MSHVFSKNIWSPPASLLLKPLFPEGFQPTSRESEIGDGHPKNDEILTSRYESMTSNEDAQSTNIEQRLIDEPSVVQDHDSTQEWNNLQQESLDAFGKFLESQAEKSAMVKIALDQIGFHASFVNAMKNDHRKLLASHEVRFNEYEAKINMLEERLSGLALLAERPNKSLPFAQRLQDQAQGSDSARSSTSGAIIKGAVESKELAQIEPIANSKRAAGTEQLSATDQPSIEQAGTIAPPNIIHTSTENVQTPQNDKQESDSGFETFVLFERHKDETDTTNGPAKSKTEAQRERRRRLRAVKSADKAKLSETE
jgi:hypothetical protein